MACQEWRFRCPRAAWITLADKERAAGGTDQLATVMQKPWLALRARRFGQLTNLQKCICRMALSKAGKQRSNQLNITPRCLYALRNKVVIGPQITVTGTGSLLVGQVLLMVLSMHQLGQITAGVNVSCWQ